MNVHKKNYQNKNNNILIINLNLKQTFPPHNPSMPSIKLKAFMRITMEKAVNK